MPRIEVKYFGAIWQFLGRILIIIVIMCVDDYEFRHFSARREKICRKFVIINEDDVVKTFYVNISQFE